MRFRMKARDGGDPRRLADMDVGAYLDDKERKPEYVKTMFDVIAPGYDTFTRIFSFGMDDHWKALLTEEAARRVPRPDYILDLACGTCDLGIKFVQKARPLRALAFDFSDEMLAEAKARIQTNGCQITLATCDMMHLAIKDGSIDVVLIGYGLRNVSDAVGALREVARVLKPGGILATLDFYQPADKVWRSIFLSYMTHTGRIAGWLWHREPTTYSYIADSIRRYVTVADFESMLTKVGFRVEWRLTPLRKAIGIHVARKVSFQ